MRRNHLTLSILSAALVAAISLSATSVALAQRDAGAKARGEIGTGFWTNQRAARRMQHALDYSKGIYEYSRDAKEVQAKIAEKESAELGRNIEAAKNEVSAIRKEYGDDKNVQASLKAIEEHLSAAATQHEKLHAECQSDQVDSSKTMECCNTITKELEKAIAEHAALMRQLGIDKKAASTKAE